MAEALMNEDKRNVIGEMVKARMDKRPVSIEFLKALYHLCEQQMKGYSWKADKLKREAAEAQREADELKDFLATLEVHNGPVFK